MILIYSLNRSFLESHFGISQIGLQRPAWGKVQTLSATIRAPHALRYNRLMLTLFRDQVPQ